MVKRNPRIKTEDKDKREPELQEQDTSLPQNTVANVVKQRSKEFSKGNKLVKDVGFGKQSKFHPSLPRTYEKNFHQSGFDFIIGVDEAGRGPLAGPVVAAACFVPLGVTIDGVTDSKQVDEETREKVYEALIHTPGVVYSACEMDNFVIDELNILQATLEAMAVSCLSVLDSCSKVNNEYQESLTAISKPTVKVLIDGNKIPKKLLNDQRLDCQAVVRGDAKVFCIAAASIIAKVTRDRIMQALDVQYPQYGFKQHKGYPTQFHQKAIFQHGVSVVHRFTFQPIRGWVEAGRFEIPEEVKAKRTAVQRQYNISGPALKKQVKDKTTSGKKIQQRMRRQRDIPVKALMNESETAEPMVTRKRMRVL